MKNGMLNKDPRFAIHEEWMADVNWYHKLLILGFKETADYFTARGLMRLYERPF